MPDEDEALTFSLAAGPYTVAFAGGTPDRTVSGTELYLDPDYVVFTDPEGNVTAVFPAHTVASIVPLAPTTPA